MKFLGIDLGWRSQPTGLCCLEWDGQHLQLHDLDRQAEIPEILAWIDSYTSPDIPALVAVDAPTLIPNATSSRLPDKLTHKYFGKYHAGCYPANANLPFAERTVGFGLALESRGFHHADHIIPQQLGRYQIEVFPHPAIVQLFGLDRILKYKKGKLADRKRELLKLHHFITQVLTQREPPLSLASSEFLKIDFSTWKPSTLAFKALEDQLDSMICAYVGAYWWYWGAAKNQVLGDRSTGYIIVPDRPGGLEPPLIQHVQEPEHSHRTATQKQQLM